MFAIVLGQEIDKPHTGQKQFIIKVPFCISRHSTADYKRVEQIPSELPRGT